MKKILLWLFWLISLWLINFSSAWSYIYSWNYEYLISSSSQTNWVTTLSLYIPIFSSNFTWNDIWIVNVSCVISNLYSDWLNFWLNASSYWWNFRYWVIDNLWLGSHFQNNYITSLFSNWTYTDVFNVSWIKYISSLFLQGYISRPHDSWTVSFDFSCTISWDNIINQADLNQTCPTCPTCPWNGWSCSVNDKLSDNILYSGNVSLSSSSYSNIFNYWDNGAWTYCIKLTSSSAQTLTFGFANWWTTTPSNLYTLYNDQYWNWVCLYWNKAYFNAKLNSSSNTVSYEVYKLTDLLSDDIPCSTSSCDYSDYILLSDVTKNYCTNRYSTLIDEDDITSWYCETQFWLIDPENCPASGWTGDINRSSFWVDNRQIQGASSIYLYLPDFLTWDYTYLDSGATLQIDVENEWDQDYIQNILDIQSYHPDNDQFAVSFTWFLYLLMPYIIITLFIVFVWRLIRRIFK